MYYTGDALTELKKIKATYDNHLDFSTMPAFAVKTLKKPVFEEKDVISPKGVLTKQNIKVGDEEELGRDLGAMISMLTVGIQQLLDRVEQLEENK